MGGKKAVGRELYRSNRPIDPTKIPLTLISPIFGHLSDDVFGEDSDLRSEDFAPARQLANMLSMLAPEHERARLFRRWLCETLDVFDPETTPGWGKEPRLERIITSGGKSYQSDGHIVLRKRILVMLKCTPETSKGSSEPHLQNMGYYRAYYMRDAYSDLVGQNCLPAFLIAQYGK